MFPDAPGPLTSAIRPIVTVSLAAVPVVAGLEPRAEELVAVDPVAVDLFCEDFDELLHAAMRTPADTSAPSTLLFV